MVFIVALLVLLVHCAHDKEICVAFPDNITKLRKGASDFLTAILYPNNVDQAKAIESPLFTPDVIGRADITTIFKGAELNTEYVFGLFASIMSDESMFNNLGSPISATPMSFIAGGNFVSTDAVFIVEYPAWGLDGKIPILASFKLEFDECNRIRQYDLSFPRFEWTQFETMKLARRKLSLLKGTHHVSDEEIMEVQDTLLINSICSVHQRFCRGGNEQYESLDECKAFVGKLRTGRSWEYGANTKICRAMHQNMVPRRPEVHCKHIGKDGGDMCKDREYRKIVLDQPFKPGFVTL